MPPLSVRPALSPVTHPTRRAVAPLAAVSAALFSMGVAVTLGGAPAAASSSAMHVVASVSGAAGGVTAMTLSTSGGVAFVVDGSDAVGLIDTATNAMTGATSSPPAWLGVPTDLATAPDDTGAYVVTDDGWVSLVHGDGSVDAVSALPGTGFGALAAVANGPSIVVVPSAVSPSAIYRVNVGAGTISPIPLGTATPSTLGRVAVGAGNGDDNPILLAGTAGAVGVLYLFDGPFALTGPTTAITLPSSSGAYDVALSPDGAQAAVTSPIDGLVFLVDVDPTSPGFGSVSATVSAVPATRVAYSPDGSALYVVGANTVTVVDPVTGTAETSFAIDETSAAAIAVSPSGARVWVADAHVPGGIAMLADPAVTAPAANATVGAMFSAMLTASGFDLPVTYAATPALPAGLTLDPATGTVSGTPSLESPATAYTITASSSDGAAAATTWTIAVGAAPAAAAPAPANGESDSHRLADSGGAVNGPVLGVGVMLLAGGGVLLTRRRLVRHTRRDGGA